MAGGQSQREEIESMPEKEPLSHTPLARLHFSTEGGKCGILIPFEALLDVMGF